MSPIWPTFITHTRARVHTRTHALTHTSWSYSCLFARYVEHPTLRRVSLTCKALNCSQLQKIKRDLIEKPNAFSTPLYVPLNSAHYLGTLSCVLLNVCSWYISFAWCATSRGWLCLGRMSSCSLIGLSHVGVWGGRRMFFHMKDQLSTFSTAVKTAHILLKLKQALFKLVSLVFRVFFSICIISPSASGGKNLRSNIEVQHF